MPGDFQPNLRLYTAAMARQNPVGQASFEEYLELEARSLERHEFVDGYLFAMAGGSANHNRIVSRLNRLVFDAAEASGCELFIAEMILRTPNGRGYYPDLFLCCEQPDGKARYKNLACWIIEVLSETTEAIDRGEKLQNYTTIPTLKSYVLVSQDKPLVELFERLENSSWRYTSLGPEGILRLPCLELNLEVSQIYQGVRF
jgi:Uma2 family endonuclease